MNIKAIKESLKLCTIGLCLFIMTSNALGNTPETIKINGDKSWYCLQDYALFLGGTNGHRESDDVIGMRETFQPWSETSFLNDIDEIWILFNVENSQSTADSIYFNGQLFDYIDLYEITNEGATLISSSGYLIPINKRPIKEWGTLVATSMRPNESKELLLRLKSVTRNSKQLMSYVTVPCMKAFTQRGVLETYSLPTYMVFFFYGAILMMAVYNLGISLSTQFKEYLLFSAYNFLTVMTVFTTSGHHLEYNWVDPFDLERNLRFVSSLLVAYFYVQFSIKFLDVKKLNKVLFHVLSKGNLVYLLLIPGLLFSLFNLVFVIFTVTTILLFTTILITTFIISRENRYARFFLLGNVIVCSAAFLQLASLYNLVTTTEMVMGSFIILMLEIIVFSFAVAYKLKVSKRAMLDMKFSNLIQKEKLKMEEEIRERLELEVGDKGRALTSSSVQWLNMSDKLEKLKESIQSNFEVTNPKETKMVIRQLNEIKSFEDQWNSFKIHFESVHPGFFHNLEKAFPSLTQNDLKLCAFMKMKLSNQEIAIILNVTKKAIEQSKRRMRKKLDLAQEENILRFLEKSMNTKSHENDLSSFQFVLE